MEIDCPTCANRTTLYMPDTARAEVLEEAPILEENSGSHLNATFTGAVTPAPVGLLYKIGMVVVLITMVILPIIYFALIGTAGWGVYLWATKGTFILGGGGGGRAMLLKLAIYLTPLFSGIVVVLFMIKPLLARRVPPPHPLGLSKEAAPALYELIEKICVVVGAPKPSRVDVDCQLNASASFRRGMRSFFSSDLVLTVGMPLVAGLTAKQLAGVLAHEFGHFTQGFGMRLTYIIRSINAWFARIAYERDAWDMTLEEWGRTEDFRISIIVNLGRLAVWFSRLILKILLWIGHAIGCFMLRQMEYDADSYAVQLVGGETVESTTKRLHTMGNSLELAYKAMRVPWNNDRRLPDNFMEYFTNMDATVPLQKKVDIEDRVGLGKTGFFDTHPADGDRIRKARQAQAEGVLHMDGPASSLFASYEGLCKQVTLLHYTEDLGIETELAKFYRPEQENKPESSDAPTAPEPPKEERRKLSVGGLKVRSHTEAKGE